MSDFADTSASRATSIQHKDSRKRSAAQGGSHRSDTQQCTFSTEPHGIRTRCGFRCFIIKRDDATLEVKRPLETFPFQPLQPQAKACALPIERFDLGAPLVDEAEQIAAERIVLEGLRRASRTTLLAYDKE